MDVMGQVLLWNRALSNFIGAQVEKLADETSANYSTAAPVSWGQAQFDSTGLWSVGSPTKLIIPSSLNGYFATFFTTLTINNITNTHSVTMSIRKNGQLIWPGAGGVSATPQGGAENTTTRLMIQAETQSVQVATGDEFEVWMQTFTDASIDIEAARSSFGCYFDKARRGCLVARSADLNATNFAFSVLTGWNVNLYDTDNLHSIFYNNGRIIVSSSVAGRYGIVRARAHLNLASAGANWAIDILKNGLTVTQAGWREIGFGSGSTSTLDTTTGLLAEATTHPFLLVQGDYLEFRLRCSDTSTNLIAAYSTFGMEILPSNFVGVLAGLNADVTLQNYSAGGIISYNGPDLYDPDNAHDPASTPTEIIIPPAWHDLKAIAKMSVMADAVTAGSSHTSEIVRDVGSGATALFDGFGGWGAFGTDVGSTWNNGRSQILTLVAGHKYLHKVWCTDTSVTLQLESTAFGMRLLGLPPGVLELYGSIPTSGVFYEQGGGSYAGGTLTAYGGSAPYTFSILSGALPPGLPLVQSGSVATISGTPTSADEGVWNFTVRVTDSASATIDKVCSFTIGYADLYYNSVVLLASFNGANGALAYSDEKRLAAYTFSGNTVLSNTQTKFGLATSGKVDGTGDAFSLADSNDWALGSASTSKYAVEGWFYCNTLTAAHHFLLGQSGGVGTVATQLFMQSSDLDDIIWVTASAGTADFSVVTTGAGIAAGRWIHVAVSHNSDDVTRIFVDGAMLAKATSGGGVIGAGSTQVMALGNNSSLAFGLDGWLQDWRITKGEARYTSDTSFTPPTRPYPRMLAPFVPTDLGTTVLKAWFDFSDVNFFTSVSGAVSQALDKSGNNNILVQATAGLRPLTGVNTLNGFNVFTFDGVDDALGQTAALNYPAIAGGATVVVVRKITSGTSAGLFWAYVGGGGFGDSYTLGRDAGNMGAWGNATSNATGSSAVFADSDNTDWDISSSTHIVASRQIYHNGLFRTSTVATVTNNAIGGVMIGQCLARDRTIGRFLGGQIAEVLVAAGTDPAIRQKLEGYAAWKWGLQGRLDSGHLYKNGPP